MELPVFDKRTSPDVVIGALHRAGAAVVTSVVNNDIVDACNAELRTEFDARGRHQENDFNGYRTLRASSVWVSSTTAELIGHPLVLAVADAVLRPHCLAYRIEHHRH